MLTPPRSPPPTMKIKVVGSTSEPLSLTHSVNLRLSGPSATARLLSATTSPRCVRTTSAPRASSPRSAVSVPPTEISQLACATQGRCGNPIYTFRGRNYHALSGAGRGTHVQPLICVPRPRASAAVNHASRHSHRTRSGSLQGSSLHLLDTMDWCGPNSCTERMSEPRPVR